MNSLESVWEVVNPLSETRKTARRMRGQIFLFRGLDYLVKKNKLKPEERDKMRAENRMEFRATDVTRDKFRARVQWLLKLLERNHPALKYIQCASPRNDDDQALGLAKRIQARIEHDNRADYYGDGTALDAIHRSRIRKTDDREGAIMKNAATRLEQALEQGTFRAE